MFILLIWYNEWGISGRTLEYQLIDISDFPEVKIRFSYLINIFFDKDERTNHS